MDAILLDGLRAGPALRPELQPVVDWIKRIATGSPRARPGAIAFRDDPLRFFLSVRCESDAVALAFVATMALCVTEEVRAVIEAHGDGMKEQAIGYNVGDAVFLLWPAIEMTGKPAPGAVLQ
ncbi:MAG TPA: hypothetical protein VK630_04240 [Reyranella sp.]|nr:hypothetical protein [Reyranella sp.]